MTKTVSAADANRQFSQLLRAVGQGHSYVVTSHGNPVAKIIPIADGAKLAAGARNALLTRLRSQRVINVGSWTRDELYEETK